MFQLRRAQYKKIPFLMRSATTNGGHKNIVYQYPGADVQAVEELGLKPRDYSVTIVIPNDQPDLTYEENRDRLLRVLDERGEGVLMHPTFGRVENVLVMTWSLNETITELGRATINVSFQVSNSTGQPVQAGNSEAGTASLNADLQAAINTDVAGNWAVTNIFTGNFQDAAAVLDDVTTSFKTASLLGIRTPAEISQFTADLNRFSDSINALISSPQVLANSIGSLFSSVSQLFETPADSLSSLQSFFGFSGGEGEITNTTTAGLQERDKNRVVIDNLMGAASLGYAYEAAAQIEFQTIPEIDTVNTLLENQYAAIAATLVEPLSFIEQSASSSSVFSFGTTSMTNSIDALNALRVQFNKFLDTERLTARQIITVNIQRTNISELAYRYYGSTELVQTLVEINGIGESSFVEGDIEILTA